jgi:Holliday junction resolvase RusA-like endonuclease
MFNEYSITPVPKPRMTQRDKWKQRPCVMRYRKFKDECRAAGIEIPESGCSVVFYIPMPKSWSNKKKRDMAYRPHQQRGDLDNYLKSLLDAVMDEDCYVWQITVEKRWHHSGMIRID